MAECDVVDWETDPNVPLADHQELDRASPVMPHTVNLVSAEDSVQPPKGVKYNGQSVIPSNISFPYRNQTLDKRPGNCAEKGGDTPDSGAGCEPVASDAQQHIVS